MSSSLHKVKRKSGQASVARMQSGIQYLKYYRGITTSAARKITRKKLQVDGFGI